MLYFVRGRYRAARHHRAKSCMQGSSLCYICLRPFDVPIPLRMKTELTPCCARPYHADCFLTNPTCRGCKTSLRVLPCAFCRGKIADEVDCYREYKESLPHQTPCCGADSHASCRSAAEHHKCPICQCPLSNWQVDKELDQVGHVLSITLLLTLTLRTFHKPTGKGDVC